MGLFSRGIFASEIWETYFREGVFLEGLIIGILRYIKQIIPRTF